MPICLLYGKAQGRGEEDKADKGRGGKTISVPAVGQVSVGSGQLVERRRKMEKSVYKVTGCAPPTTAVSRLMTMTTMMMLVVIMMMMMMLSVQLLD